MSETEKTYELIVCEWEGAIRCIYLNDYRIAGGKPWGGGRIVARFKVKASDIGRAIGGASVVKDSLITPSTAGDATNGQ